MLCLSPTTPPYPTTASSSPYFTNLSFSTYKSCTTPSLLIPPPLPPSSSHNLTPNTLPKDTKNHKTLPSQALNPRSSHLISSAHHRHTPPLITMRNSKAPKLSFNLTPTMPLQQCCQILTPKSAPSPQAPRKRSGGKE